MLILDMRWTGLFVLVLILGGITVFLWSQYRNQQRLVSVQPQFTFPSALTGAPFGVLVVRQQQIEYANLRSLDLLELDREVLTLPDTEWADLLRADIVSAQGVNESQGVYRSVVLSSERAVTWWVIPGEGVQAIFVLDLSEQHRVQHQTDTLIHDLGHELRTPIAAILTHLDILGFEDISPDIHAQSFTLTKQEVQRLSRLVDDLLQLGRVSTTESSTRRPVDLVQLIEGILAQTRPGAEQVGAVISLEVHEKMQYVSIDPDQVRQVLLNLVDNAVKYGGQGVHITLGLQADATGITCSVCDNGPGIPEQHLSRVTERFYRVSRNEVEGSGLGLALVKEILRQHHSELRITSPVIEGRGTCAHFTLPYEVAQ